MNKKLIALIVISLFALTTVFSATPTKAAEGDYISYYIVRDLATGEILMQKTSGPTSGFSLLEGTQVNVTLTISIPMDVPDSTLSLTTSMEKSSSQDKWWELKTTDYVMDGYNPNSQTVTFAQNEGELVISCYGKIPTGLTTGSTSGTGTQLHKPFLFWLIKLSSSSGQVIDQITPYIIDAKIAEYNNLYSQSNTDLQGLIDEGVADAYVSLYKNVINGSKDQANEGYVDNAISQLHQLAITEAPPITAGASMADALFIPVAAILAVLAVIGILMFMRARGKATYVSQVVEDQIRDLEGLSVRAAKVDRSLSAGLETIEDRLKNAVGA